MGKYVTVATVDDLAPGEVRAVVVKGKRIALCRVEDEFYAVDDLCPHDFGPLGEGELADKYEIECPRHGARFDVRTGEVRALPATEPITAYRLRVVGGEVQVEVEE
ncbi:MAG: non-heme iron oxygenase ferredoxin subunit [Armatimonadota bacterium]